MRGRVKLIYIYIFKYANEVSSHAGIHVIWFGRERAKNKSNINSFGTRSNLIAFL